MNKLMPIGLIAVLTGAGTALAQVPTQRPESTQQTAPSSESSTQPRADTQRQNTPANQRQNAPANQSAGATGASKDAMSQHTALQAMDTNSDGLVSKPEYMAYYESEYGKVKKDSAGMISLKDQASSARPIASTR